MPNTTPKRLPAPCVTYSVPRECSQSPRNQHLLQCDSHSLHRKASSLFYFLGTLLSHPLHWWNINVSTTPTAGRAPVSCQYSPFTQQVPAVCWVLSSPPFNKSCLLNFCKNPLEFFRFYLEYTEHSTKYVSLVVQLCHMLVKYSYCKLNSTLHPKVTEGEFYIPVS